MGKGSTARVRDKSCRHKPRRPHDREPEARTVSNHRTETSRRHRGERSVEAQWGTWSNLLAACCASPDSMICRLSSSPSLTQSQLHDAPVSLLYDATEGAADEGNLHAVLWVQDTVIT